MPASEDGSSDAGFGRPPPERTNLLGRFRRAAQLVGRDRLLDELAAPLDAGEAPGAARDLAKPAAERTESELLLLEEVLSRLKFAKSLRVAEKVELCKSMGYRKILAGETLFRQGDPGDHFYVIIVGCVSVHIQDAQTGEDHEVAVLRNGDSFGELALMQEGNLRAASIIAKDDSEFLTIFRDDYSRILGAVSEHELADKVNLLRGLLFATCPTAWFAASRTSCPPATTRATHSSSARATRWRTCTSSSEAACGWFARWKTEPRSARCEWTRTDPAPRSEAPRAKDSPRSPRKPRAWGEIAEDLDAGV